MSKKHRRSDENVFRPSQPMDEDTQRTLSEAMEGIDLDDVMGGEEAVVEESSDEGTLEGRVVGIHEENIFVELPGAEQGVLPAEQFDEGDLPAEGDLVEVVARGYEESEGLVLLSRKGAAQPAEWDTLEVGQLVEGRVTGTNKGGLELNVNGIRAFMPLSQIDRDYIEEPRSYLDQKLRCEVVELNRAARRLIVSRRALLEAEAAEAAQHTWESLQEGQVVSGTVRRVMPYGAFVDIGGVDGLLHVSDMSYGRVEDPASVVQPGQMVEVKVLKLARDEQRVSLGLKQIKADPWLNAQTDWPVGSPVSGRVTKLADFGAFVELTGGVEGLVPISEMSYERRIHHPSEIVNVGDVVQVRVLSVDPDQRRISLSIKAAGDDPWLGASVRWPKDSFVDGIVKNVTDFGAFVELTPGVEGLVHVSQLGEGFVRAVSDVVELGQSVRARVLEVDEEQRRISLSLKDQPGSAPPIEEATSDKPSRRAKAKRKRPLKGGLD